MHRLYEWLKALWSEKVNTFIKGFCGGSIISGIFLFRDSTHDAGAFVIIALLKILAVGISGIVSGCATVLGNDFAAWLKSKWKKLTAKRITRNRKKKAA